MERVHDVVVLGKLLGRLAERLLGPKILAEIQVAQVPVDLDHVVELLDIVLVCVVYVPVGGRRDRTGIPPAVLEFAERRETCAHILLTFHEGLELVYDGLLLGEVGFALFILLTVELGTLLFIVGIHRLEILLDGLERVVRAFGGSLFAL